MSSVLPPVEDAPRLVPRPQGPVWTAAGDVRTLSTAGYALVLQVAHPTVGAGVMEHSNFREDPWGRLLRTLDYVHGSIYGGPRMAGEIGRRVREMHQTIKGVKPDGQRYHALEPDAYAWVHATLASAFIDGHAAFGTPLRADQAAAFWAEWLRMGRLIGVREQDLPADWADFRPYFDRVVAEELEDNPTVHLVIETLEQPAKPPLPGLSDGLWRVLRRPAARQQLVSTVGMLPPPLRAKLNLEWTRADARLFRAMTAASRA
ncbi:MAG TPA: oxygenase MpaB family protein, partial [Solirubrobacteraceae bacterium]